MNDPGGPVGAASRSPHRHPRRGCVATTQVGHTDHTYLVDGQGDVIVTWTADMTANDLHNDLQVLLRADGRRDGR